MCCTIRELEPDKVFGTKIINNTMTLLSKGVWHNPLPDLLFQPLGRGEPRHNLLPLISQMQRVSYAQNVVNITKLRERLESTIRNCMISL